MNTQRNPLIVILAIFLVFVVFGVAFYLTFFTKDTTKETPQNPTDFSKNYSYLNLVVPGKSTLEDVKRINGQPSSTRSLGGKTYLYYKTPSSEFTNVVLIENGTVKYALENVFSLYRGLYSEYVTKNGNPNFNVHGNANLNDYPWAVYLNKGVAIQNSNNYITAVLYFVPTNESGFMSGVAKELGLSKEVPQSVDEPGPPQGIN